MTVLSDLASAFAEVAMTVPVQYGALFARGFFDRAGSVRPLGRGVAVQTEKDTLYLQKDSLGPIAVDSTILVGEVGAETAEGGMEYAIGFVNPVDDGLVIAIALSGGDS